MGTLSGDFDGDILPEVLFRQIPNDYKRVKSQGSWYYRFNQYHKRVRNRQALYERRKKLGRKM